MYKKEDHTFAVCAYKESPYLEECIQSLKKQRVLGKILIATSTPNQSIYKIAEKYQIPVYVNTGEKGIAGDWNFAYASCDTPLVTITHQDDVYDKKYLEFILHRINQSRKPLIGFADYCELKNGVTFYQSNLLKIKRILLLPLKIRLLDNNRWIRRRILSIGSAICCPTVTLVKDNLPAQIFKTGMKSNIDWEAWEKITKLKGAFCYCPQQLVSHRIHEDSTTTSIINSGVRHEEDLEMFEKFWPKAIARFINKVYQSGEKGNQV